MTKTLDSFAQLAEHISGDQLRLLVGIEHAMGRAVEIIKENAKDRIGEYQDAAGPFPAWEPLADSTEFDKARRGYPVDAPLLRDGDLRESIEGEHHGLEGVVGSKDPVMGYQEYGTPTIPPRPVIGPAGFSNHARVGKMIGKAGLKAIGQAGGLVGDYDSPMIAFTKT